MQLGTNIQYVIEHCGKGFQGWRSKVKVVIRPVNLHWQR